MEAVTRIPAGRAKARLAADVVFTHCGSRAGALSEPRNQVVVAPQHSPARAELSPEGLRSMLRFAMELAVDRQVVIVLHERRADFDRALALAATDGYPEFADIRVVSPPDLDELDRLYRSAHCVVSARMHPLILGWVHGARCIAVPGSRKVADIAYSLELGVFVPEFGYSRGGGEVASTASRDRVRAAALENFSGVRCRG